MIVKRVIIYLILAVAVGLIVAGISKYVVELNPGVAAAITAAVVMAVSRVDKARLKNKNRSI